MTAPIRLWYLVPMANRKTLRRIFSLLLTVSLTQPAAAQEAKHGNAVVIGAISILTGEGASWGVNHQRGTLLAAEEWNTRGGINGKKIEILSEDSPSGLARNAVSAYRKLTSTNNIHFILGPVAMDELLALAPLAQKDHVFLGGATYMPNAPENFFTTWIDADIESALIAETVCGKYKRVAVLASQQSWESQVGHRFREACVRLGSSISLFEEPSFEATDLKSEALRTRQSNSDALFIASYLLLPNYLKNLRTLGLRLPTFSIELDQTVISNSWGAAEGLVFIAPSSPSDGFVEKFKRKWNANPDIPAASAYDAASLLFAAIQKEGEDVSKVIGYFRNFKGYDGATGHIERKDGKTVIPTSLYQVSGGRIRVMP